MNKKLFCATLLAVAVVLNISYLLFTNYDEYAPRVGLHSEIGNAIFGTKVNGPKSTDSANGRPKPIVITRPTNHYRDPFLKEFNRMEYPENYNYGMNEIKQLFGLMSKIEPGIAKFTDEEFNRNIMADRELIQSGELPPTSHVLGMYLQVSEEKKNILKQTHKKVMDSLPPAANNIDVFGGRGVVMYGDGARFPMLMTSIKWIRSKDKNIPIELFVADHKSYEKQICENLFSQMNVECRILSDIYGEELTNKLNDHYSRKLLSILASKFDHLLYTDASSYTLQSIDTAFNSKVYEDTGMLLSSDYWPRYTSPHFYEIVGIDLGERARGSQRDNALRQSDRKNAIPGKSTESSQLFVHKSRHLRSLLLATYYNMFGPGIYFPLLNQGGPGEGEKETFAAAAVLCNEMFYQTETGPDTLGYQELNQHWTGMAMVQSDWQTDFEKQKMSSDQWIEPQTFSVRTNNIVANPKYLLEEDNSNSQVARLKQQRVLGDLDHVQSKLQSIGDIEHEIFQTITDVTCEWALEEGFIPQDWIGEDVERLCDLMSRHTDWLEEHPQVQRKSHYWYEIEQDG